MRRGAGEHDWGFFAWFATGFLIVFGFITGFSIGLPFLLAGAFLLARLSLRDRGGVASLGSLAGAGAVCLVIATINALSGELSPTVWATVGVALTGAPTFAFWWLRCRPVVS